MRGRAARRTDSNPIPGRFDSGRWEVERPGSSAPDWERVRKLVARFGTVSNLSLAHNEQNRLFEAWWLVAEPVST